MRQFSPDNRWLLIASHQPAAGKTTVGGYLLWDVAAQKPVAELGGQPTGICRCAFTPDSKLLAVLNSEGVITLYDAKTGGEVLRWAADANPMGSITFTPDGGSLAFFANAGTYTTAQLLDVAGLAPWARGNRIGLVEGAENRCHVFRDLL